MIDRKSQFLGIAGIIVVFVLIAVLLSFHSISGRTVTNMYFVPVGSLKGLHETDGILTSGWSMCAISPDRVGGSDSCPPEKKKIDITIEVDEYNLSFIHNRIHNRTIVSVTYDEASVYPDLERAMHGETRDPVAWKYGHRVVKWLEGNESDIHRFYLAACGNKTWDECYPNPPLFRYHDQYYMISYDRIGSHQTYSPSPQSTY